MGDAKLDVYMYDDNKSRAYQCNTLECGAQFSNFKLLKRHVRKHHGRRTCRRKVTEHRCDECDKSFQSSSNLKKHMQLHAATRPFSCEYCEKKFSQLSTMREHYRVHTGIKPFRCKECNHAFTTSSNLVRHMRIHTGERPYACTRCNKSFNQSTSLRSHMEKVCFKGFACRICGKRCGDFYHLREHMKNVHANEAAAAQKKTYKDEEGDYDLYEDLDKFVNFGFSEKNLSNKSTNNDSPYPYKNVQKSESITYGLRTRDSSKITKIDDSDIDEEVSVTNGNHDNEKDEEEDEENLLEPFSNDNDYEIIFEDSDNFSIPSPCSPDESVYEDSEDVDSDIETLSVELDDQDEVYEMGILTSVRVVGESNPTDVVIIPEYSDEESQEENQEDEVNLIHSEHREPASQVWRIVETGFVPNKNDI